MTAAEALAYLREKGLEAFLRQDHMIVVAKSMANHENVRFLSKAVCITRVTGGWIAERAAIGSAKVSSEVMKLEAACVRAETLLLAMTERPD